MGSSRLKLNFKSFIAESINDIGRLKAIFLVGFPGSGKSYTLSKIKSGQVEPRIVNTDRVVEFFGKTNDVNLSEPLSDVLVNKAKILTKQFLFQYINGLLPLVIDSTSSNSRNLLLRYGALESVGYDIGAVFINTDLDVAIERIKQRDRKVPEEFVREVHKKLSDVKSFYKSKFNFTVEIDNNTGELTDDVILDAFKKVTNFYTSPLKNPMGQILIKKMEEKGEKYLLPNIFKSEELIKVINLWYRG